MTTAAPHQLPVDHAALERAVTRAQGPEGANLQEVTGAYASLAGHALAPRQIAAGLRELMAAGRVHRSKGPRGENTYLLAPQGEEDPLERLAREKSELQRALGALSAAATFATARLEKHQRREDQWRELIQATEEAKRALGATN